MEYQEVMALEVGEQLDRAVADSVIKIEASPWFKPSTNGALSFAVVDKMIQDDWSMELIVGADGYSLCRFFSAKKEDPMALDENQIICDSPEEAICRAALLVSEKENLDG